ncbi:MAG: LytTR family transcriptional regulator DNA-binding domain-containing protein [Oscillospiraceae bacterium]|nr:LytTR family transcriptional regulator DNA-binding domain-containing protein [Oscillospiraceae bacterium]
MLSVALYGDKCEELKAAKAAILAIAHVSVQIDVFSDFALLQKAFFTLDMLLIENSLFYHVLPQIQGIIDSTDPQKAIGQKIIITNYTTPITKKQVDAWVDSLGGCEYVKIPTGIGFHAERIHDILYFENKNRKVYVKTPANFYKSSLSLRDAAKLTACDSFASPYVSFLVNLRWVEAVKGRDVALKNGETLPLSQKKAASFRKHYRAYMSKL